MATAKQPSAYKSRAWVGSNLCAHTRHGALDAARWFPRFGPLCNLKARNICLHNSPRNRGRLKPFELRRHRHRETQRRTRPQGRRMSRRDQTASWHRAQRWLLRRSGAARQPLDLAGSRRRCCMQVRAPPPVRAAPSVARAPAPPAALGTPRRAQANTSTSVCGVALQICSCPCATISVVMAKSSTLHCS